MGSGSSILPKVFPEPLPPSKLAWISSLPCFAHLNEDQLLKVVEKVTPIDYKAGEEIITEGSPGTLFGIIISGSVSIHATGPQGNKIILCTQKEGFFFGEAAIIGNTTTTATIVSETKCSILALMSKDLQRLTLESPEVKDSLLHTVSLRLKQNLLAIPIFAQMKSILEEKKYFKLLGAFDLLSTIFELESVDAKEIIFSEGDPGDKFYVVCEGCVRISSKGGAEKDLTLSMLTKNDVFGEISLLEDTTRTATARAFESSLLLSITGERFRSLFNVFPFLEGIMSPLLRDRTANSLKQISFFNELEEEKRKLVGQMLTFNSYPAGMEIVKEGDLDNGLYFLMEGEIMISAQDRFSKTTVDLGEMGPGSIIGELALLNGSNRTATVTSKGPCRFLRMDPRNTRSLLNVAPELMSSLIKTAKQHRQNSIDLIDHAADFIPPIDETTNSKLLLYSLLRNAPSHRHETISKTKSRGVVQKANANINAAGDGDGDGDGDGESGRWSKRGESGEVSTTLLNTVEELKKEKHTLTLENKMLSIDILDMLKCISMLEKHLANVKTISAAKNGDDRRRKLSVGLDNALEKVMNSLNNSPENRGRELKLRGEEIEAKIGLEHSEERGKGEDGIAKITQLNHQKLLDFEAGMQLKQRGQKCEETITHYKYAEEDQIRRRRYSWPCHTQSEVEVSALKRVNSFLRAGECLCERREMRELVYFYLFFASNVFSFFLPFFASLFC